jgi:UPF0716 protein FxsA
MFARLALLFVVVPLIELALLIQVGQVVGLVPTVLLVLATGVGGAALARREGLRTVARIQSTLGRGELPGEALMDGAAILFGGALLLTPGVLTDFVGLALLLPLTRRWFARRLRRAFEKQLETGAVTWSTGFVSMGGGMGGMGDMGGPGMGRGGREAGGMGSGRTDGGSRVRTPWESDAASRLGLDPRNEIRGDDDSA